MAVFVHTGPGFAILPLDSSMAVFINTGPGNDSRAFVPVFAKCFFEAGGMFGITPIYQESFGGGIPEL